MGRSIDDSKSLRKQLYRYPSTPLVYLSTASNPQEVTPNDYNSLHSSATSVAILRPPF